MSLLLAYTFNEQSATPCDYSGNKNTGSSANLSFTAGQNYGYAASYANNSYVKVTPSNFNGLSAFSVFIHFNAVSLSSNLSGKYYLAYKQNSFNIFINSSGNIQFNIYHGSVYTLTTAAAVTTGWHTLSCVWNGATMYVYINGVADANTTALTGMDNGGSTLFIGNDSDSDIYNTFNGYIDSVEIRSQALSPENIIALHNSPGGMQIAATPHNFATGDLIADSTLTCKGVVTWVTDAQTFYFYPVTPVGSGYGKTGNIYQSARQRYMEFINDFDGNGNGQISVKEPMAGWADYNAPANQYTFDYRGIINNGMGGSLQWFSEYQERYSAGNNLTSLYQETLTGGSLPADGSYFTFAYTVNVANNPNAKTMYVKFANQTMVGFTLNVNNGSPFYASGRVKVTNHVLKQAAYYLTVDYNGLQTKYAGTLSNIDFSVNNKLILQGQGIADNDITAIDGNGALYKAAAF